MRIWSAWMKDASSRVGKVVLALVFASAIGGVCIAPAFGADNDRHDNDRRDNDRRDNDRHDNDRRDNGRHEQYQGHGRNVYQPPPRYYYYPPVYAPPPVVYTPAPYQSPGISLFFPFLIR